MLPPRKRRGRRDIFARRSVRRRRQRWRKNIRPNKSLRVRASFSSFSCHVALVSARIIYSLEGNKRISHISLIFTLHNLTSPFVEAKWPRFDDDDVATPRAYLNLNAVYVAENLKMQRVPTRAISFPRANELWSLLLAGAQKQPLCCVWNKPYWNLRSNDCSPCFLYILRVQHHGHSPHSHSREFISNDHTFGSLYLLEMRNSRSALEHFILVTLWCEFITLYVCHCSAPALLRAVQYNLPKRHDLMTQRQRLYYIFIQQRRGLSQLIFQNTR